MSEQLDLFAADEYPSELEIAASYEDGREITAEDLQWGEIEGEEGGEKLPSVQMKAYTGGAMRVAQFFHPVVVDLAGVKSSNKTLPFFRGHDPDKIIGHGNATIQATEITAEGVVSADNEYTADVLKSSKRGFPWQASIGASVDEMEFVKEGEKATANGKTFKGPVLVARKSTLNEISFVPLGADKRTSSKVAATSADSKEFTMKTDFQKWLEANEWDEEQLTDKQKTTLKAQFDTEQERADDLSAKEGDFSEVMEARKKERDRVNSIKDLCAEYCDRFPEQLDDIEALGKTAIAKKTTPEQFELELLRSTRPTGPPQFGVSTKEKNPATPKVVEAAICRSLGMQSKTLESSYDEEILEATDKHFRHGIGLKELLFMAAAANGQTYTSTANLEGLLKAAFGYNGQQIRATQGWSTYSLSGILGNVMNKRLEDFFNFVESGWREISAIRPVSDFKQITSYSLTGDLMYEKIGDAGEIKHGTLGSTSYTNQAETYAKMLAITRKDIINDDLGAFNSIPRKLGRGGALKINDVFWTEFMDNSSFFTSGNGNFTDGATTALDIDALDAVVALFRNQTDPDGYPVGVEPRILLVPPGIEQTAKNIFNSTLFRDTTANTVRGLDNPFAGMFRPIVSSYLANSSYTGNSAVAWYLLADPMDTPVIETCFLNGRDMPFVESADAAFDTLGIQVRAYHDFGVSKQEYRGGVKSKGEA